jgi:transcriptional regulator with PAS, ATPase and Fis domain
MEIPPLRARREDIPLLCEHFIARFNKIQNKNVSGLSHEALSLLMNYAFLGNVRELAHMIEHAFVLVGEGPITPAHLPQQLLPVPGQIGTKRPRDLVQTMEARVIEETLRQHGFNKTRAAKELGMHKSTLFRKIASLGIRDQARVRRHSDD